MKISLVIPCYNEELNIQKGVLDRIGNYTSERNAFTEVILVDDGSIDNSKEIVRKKYLKKFPKFVLVENEHQGKAVAVMTGIQKAHGDYVIFTDIDLATPIDETKNMIAEFEKGNDIVIGTRSTHREGAPLTRKLQSVGFIVLRNLIVGLNGITDTQCGFKGFKRSVALDVLSRLKVFTSKKHVDGSSVSAGFDLEFLFIAKKRGYSIDEMPVKWRHAESKNVSLVKDSIETIRDLVLIRLNDLKGLYSQV